MFKALLKLIGFTLFFSCLLTPPVYSLLLVAGPKLNLDLSWPFSRVYDRVAMVCAAVFLVAYRKEFSLSQLQAHFSKQDLGLKGRAFLIGVSLSAATALVMLPFVVQSSELFWRDKDLQYYCWKLLKVIPAAILISVIEESFFRQILLSKLLERFRFWSAAVVCSLIYALVHFIAPVKSYAYPGWSLFVGFEYIGLVFERLLSVSLLPAYLGLFLVGMVLCVIVQRTRSLFLCIGLHTGWVIAMKMAKYSTGMSEEAALASGVGRRYFLVAEPLVWGSIAAVWVILFLVLRSPRLANGFVKSY